MLTQGSGDYNCNLKGEPPAHIYIYINIQTYIYIYMHMYTHVYVYVCIYTYCLFMHTEMQYMCACLLEFSCQINVFANLKT